LILVLTAAAPAAARSSWMGPCHPGTNVRCHFWMGTVTSVNDGDTFDVNIDGDGTSRAFTTRITGINTTEETRYSNVPSERRGECEAVAATAQVDKLLRLSHHRVRIAAQNPASRASYRLLRAAAMRVHGKWVDLGQWQMERGLALPWLSGRYEWAWNGEYSRIAARAAAAQLGLWNPEACGRGPSAGVPLRIWVHWDSKSTSSADLSREYTQVKNYDPTRTVSLTGWWVRSGGPRRYHFPRGTTLPPGGTLTVFNATGTNTFDRFFWGMSNNTFPNATYDRTQLGEGAYLFDPRGNLRAYLLYPCRILCNDPLKGNIAVTANPGSSDEWVDVRNTGAAPVDLEPYAIYTLYRYYPFGPNSVLAPGEKMRVWVNGNPSNDTRLVRHWGLQHSILRMTGGVVTVRGHDDQVVGCFSWDGGSC
jgi:endonuclease YncB( thermonuclease family)